MNLNLNSLARPAALSPAVLLAGCGSMGGGSRPDAAAPAAAATSGSKIGPGMNERGEVVDSKKVVAGFGQKLKGLEDHEGEITGKPVPGSKFPELKIGMSQQQAISLLGQPNDAGMHLTGKAFIPFYFGSDRTRYEMVYKGQGRLLFATGAGFIPSGTGNANLIWIIHSATEGGTR